MSTINLIEAVLGAASAEAVDQTEALRRDARMRLEDVEYAAVGIDNHAGKFVTEVAQKAETLQEFPELAAKAVKIPTNAPVSTEVASGLDLEAIRAQIDNLQAEAA